MITLTTGTIPAAAGAQGAPPPAAPASDQELREVILALDQGLFAAFNACDLESFQEYLAEDLEFYQDNDDPTYTRAALEPTFKDRCDPDRPTRLRRELVIDSVEVHPIQSYGAVQFGQHRFLVVQEGKPDEVVSTPRFVHLWRHEDGAWRITRVISYGH